MDSIRISAPYMIACGAVWPPVCAAVISLRFMTRRAQRAQLGADDWLVLPAFVILVGMCAAAIAGTALKAVAYPTPAFDPAVALVATSREQTVTRIVYWVVEVTQVLALSFIKLSAMFFYRRVFRTGSNSAANIAIWAVIGIVAAWGIAFFWTLLFKCGTHFEYLWTNLVNQAKCSDTVAELMGFAVSDVITDFTILLFPIPLIWRLQMRTAQKVAVTAIFVIGALAVAASITRMVIFIQALSVEFSSSTDQNLLSTAGVYCMIIEVGFGLCAICLPSLSGALKVRAVQTLVAGFSSIFSRSHSRRSATEPPSAAKPHHLDSPPASKRTAFAADADSAEAPSFEMKPTREFGNSAIRVTQEVDLKAETV